MFRLYALLISITFLISLQGCSSIKPMSKSQVDAYNKITDNDFDEARSLLVKSKDDQFTLFLLASIELSEGNIDLAGEYADQLINKYNNYPDGIVLYKLIERRKAAPEERWIDSFVFAYQNSGSPKLTLIDSYLTYTTEKVAKSVQGSCKKWEIPNDIPGSYNELLWAYDEVLFCNTEEFLNMCLVYTSSDVPIEIRLFVLNYLDTYSACSDVKSDTKPFCKDKYSEISEDLCNKVKAKRKELIQQLSSEMHNYSLYALEEILGDLAPDKKLSIKNIEEIEEIIKRPYITPLRSELYEMQLKRFREIGVDAPYFSAMNSMLYNPFTSLNEAIYETSETASPELKERLGNILDDYGRQYLKRQTLIDHLFGASMLRSAAYIKNDKEHEEDIKVIREFVGSLIGDLNGPSLASQAWPIHPLLEESIYFHMKNEIEASLFFSGLDKPDVLEKYYK